jgi:KDO2-lipid IV(A) lauroyltransferase
LLVTPHLGNWELGGAIMRKREVKLLVVTLEEPAPGLTELRRASRLQRGIETFVLGQDAFAFVEIIKRLQDGTAVALLVDRPPPTNAVTVEFCGRPFAVSPAAAELARASGCAVLGVYLLRNPTGYTAMMLPEFHYDRRALGSREARTRFTQEILRAFEPVIRQHPDQWYHFVPIWPRVAITGGPAPGVAPLPS